MISTIVVVSEDLNCQIQVNVHVDDIAGKFPLDGL